MLPRRPPMRSLGSANAICSRVGSGDPCGLSATLPVKMGLYRFGIIEWPDSQVNIDITGIVAQSWGDFPSGPGLGEDLAGAS